MYGRKYRKQPPHNRTLFKQVGIAKDEEWWKLYSEIPQAAIQINHLLTNPNYPNEAVYKEFSIEKTVDQYLTFWRTKKGRT